MNEFSWRARSAVHAEMARERLDVLIIGGGITGAGLVLDAATRGLRVALVEKRDFAAGTSSRSTKLIHGGLRYLEHFDFALVREGLSERAILSRIAPHLVKPFPFLVPIYTQRGRNYDRPLKIRAGLWLYDLLAGRESFGRHRRLTREQALELAPQLDTKGLRGALLYYDALTDDSRLVIEVLKSAHALGALVVNYTRLVGLLHEANGELIGGRVSDELTGREFEVRARVIVNATGVWTDEVRALSGQIETAGKRVRPSKGVHLMLAADRLRVMSAWLIPSLTGHRFYFVVPWEGRVLVGTTDTDYAGDKEAPHAEAGEVREILGAINSYFPEARLESSDVIATFAGLRPLLSDGKKSTTAVSREEEIIQSRDGMISIAGGKLTTYRRMAERTIDLAAARLNEKFDRNGIGRSRTATVALDGGRLSRAELEDEIERMAKSEGLTREVLEHLAHSYGSDFGRVVTLAREDEQLRGRLVEGLPHIAAEIVYAVRNEMAVTLADVLTRRTRLAMLAGRAALECAPLAARFMAQELGWNGAETALQIAKFTEEFELEYEARIISSQSHP